MAVVNRGLEMSYKDDASPPSASVPMTYKDTIDSSTSTCFIQVIRQRPRPRPSRFRLRRLCC